MAEEPDLDQLCELARLRLDEEEKEEFRAKFREMCGFVDAVGEAEVDPEEDTGYLKQSTPLRADRSEQPEPSAEEKTEYRVPEVLEGDE